MNIQDVAAPTERPECLLSAIFDYQAEHLKKYLEIEGRNGIGLGILPEFDRTELGKGDSLNLHDKVAQYLIKDYCWRVTEEFTEATDAKDDREHYLEELIDGLHFMLEMFTLVGFKPYMNLEESFMATPKLGATPYDVIERLGCACNLLKNKPWKNSHMLTDITRFHRHLEEAWSMFIMLMKQEGLDADGMFDLYFRKSAVNTFRQRSNY